MQIAAALLVIGALNFTLSSNLELSLSVCKEAAALQSVIFERKKRAFYRVICHYLISVFPLSKSFVQI